MAEIPPGPNVYDLRDMDILTGTMIEERSKEGFKHIGSIADNMIPRFLNMLKGQGFKESDITFDGIYDDKVLGPTGVYFVRCGFDRQDALIKSMKVLNTESGRLNEEIQYLG